MLTKIPTQSDWIALSDVGLTAFLFGILLFLLGVAFLEWWEIRPKIKSIIKFIKSKTKKIK